MRRSPEGYGRVLFSVAGTGIGIPAQQRPRLCKTFSRVDGAFNRRRAGAGLGLAICKHLVELMDGDIGVVSEAGQGAAVRFTAVLPAAAPPCAITPAPLVRAPSRKGRILLVDDLDMNLEIAGHYLREEGYAFEPCGNAAMAISLLQQEPFDLVLMDIQMPVLDGVAATRLIRAMAPPLGAIPIIALTGNVLPQQIQSFLDAGMNGHVGKPIARAELRDKLSFWLSSPGRPVPSRASPATDFDPAKFELFVSNFGSAWVEEHAGTFARTLEAAFASTPETSRREAHKLLNFAGLLGFDRLVELCRDVENAPVDNPAGHAGILEEARAARADALRTLREKLLPATRASFVAGAITPRGVTSLNRNLGLTGPAGMSRELCGLLSRPRPSEG